MHLKYLVFLLVLPLTAQQGVKNGMKLAELRASRCVYARRPEGRPRYYPALSRRRSERPGCKLLEMKDTGDTVRVLRQIVF